MSDDGSMPTVHVHLFRASSQNKLIAFRVLLAIDVPWARLLLLMNGKGIAHNIVRCAYIVSCVKDRVFKKDLRRKCHLCSAFSTVFLRDLASFH